MPRLRTNLIAVQDSTRRVPDDGNVAVPVGYNEACNSTEPKKAITCWRDATSQYMGYCARNRNCAFFPVATKVAQALENKSVMSRD